MAAGVKEVMEALVDLNLDFNDFSKLYPQSTHWIFQQDQYQSHNLVILSFLSMEKLIHHIKQQLLILSTWPDLVRV